MDDASLQGMLSAELSELKAQMQAEKRALESLSQQHLVAREARHASILAEQSASCVSASFLLHVCSSSILHVRHRPLLRSLHVSFYAHVTGSTAEELAETKLAAQATCQVSVLHHHCANCIKKDA